MNGIVFVLLAILSRAQAVQSAEPIQAADTSTSEELSSSSLPGHIHTQDHSDWLQQIQQLQDDMRRAQVLMAQMNEKTQMQDNMIQQLNDHILKQDHKIHQLNDHILKQDSKIQQQYDHTINQDNKIQEQRTQIKKIKNQIFNSSAFPVKEKKVKNIIKMMLQNSMLTMDKGLQKRSDDTPALEPVVNQITSQITQVNAEIQALQNQVASQGTSYIRWGHSSCPDSSQVVYSGFIGGSSSTDSGAAVNHLCLPTNPVFDDRPIPSAYSDQHLPLLYGGEYEVKDEITEDLLPVCATCWTAHTSSIMIPATNTCPAGWTHQYDGHLMAGTISHAGASEFICVDATQGYQPGTDRNDFASLLYLVLTHCGSLTCPPYINNKVVTCVVCSK